MGKAARSLLITAVVFEFLTVICGILSVADTHLNVKAKCSIADIEMKMGLLRSCFKAKADLVIKVEKGKCGPTIGLKGEHTFEFGSIANGSNKTVDCNLFKLRDMSVGGGAVMILGQLFAFICGSIICAQLTGCMDYKDCVSQALNVGFASTAALLVFISVVIMCVLFVKPLSLLNEDGRVEDIDTDSLDNTQSCLIGGLLYVAEMVKEEPKREGAKLTWCFVMGWVALFFALTGLIVISVCACCCS